MVRSSLVASLFAAVAYAAGSSEDTVFKKVVPGAFIFELEEGHDPSAFYKKVEKEGETRLKLDYKLFKGVSVQLKDLEKADQTAQLMSAMPAVKKMWPVQLIPAPKPRVDHIGKPEPKHNAPLESRAVNETGFYAPHVMTQVDQLHKEGITGKGIKIAVIDTGIDYTHPYLGNGCFGEGCLVSFGTDLVGDDYTGEATPPQPDDDPMDCAGHGTHVAGIIAAQANPYGFVGAAPDATLGAYRVFGCEGEAGTDVLIAAHNQAYEDGADIITASIGGPSGWSEDAWSVAVSRIVEKGVPCTISAGNEGATGQMYTAGASNGKRVASIASVDNDETASYLYRVNYTVGDSEDNVEFGYSPGVPAAWDGVKLPLWALSTDPKDPVAIGCKDYPKDTPDLSKKIALIRRGDCTYVEKAQFAAKAGAKYIMIYNYDEAASSIEVKSVTDIKASGMVTSVVGEKWLSLLKDGKEVTLDMKSPESTTAYATAKGNTKTGGALSTYTTWGPTFEMDMDPQFSGPGGYILSTYPVALGSYAVLSGTSMSCPILAGIYALLAQSRGTFDPALLQNLLSANANPNLFNDGQKYYNYLAPVTQQGAGLVRAYDAAHATTFLEPSGLSFNDTDHLIKTLNFTLSNKGKEDITYKLSNVPAITMYTLAKGSPQPMGFPNEAVQSSASLRFSESKLTLSPGESATIDVSPVPPPGVDAKRLPIWSGYVAVNGSDGSSLSLPYQGLSGSLHKATVMEADSSYISDTTNDKYPPVKDNTTFVIPAPGNAKPGDVLPVLVLDLALGSPLIQVDIVPMTTCPPKRTREHWGTKTIGQPAGFPFTYNPRGGNAIPFNGQLNDGNYAPPGKYKFVVRALHIFGDANKKEDYDVSETPAFRIKYE